MIVVAIMAIVMTMSVPIVYKVWHKAPLRKAVADVMAVCSLARQRAILQGTMTQVTFHPKENRLEVSGIASPSRPPGEGGGPPDPASRRPPVPGSQRSSTPRSSSRRWISTCPALNSMTRSRPPSGFTRTASPTK